MQVVPQALSVHCGAFPLTGVLRGVQVIAADKKYLTLMSIKKYVA